MCRPGRYVGAAELSFFPHVQGVPTWLWTHPQAASCDLFVSIMGEGSATPLINMPPPRKILEPATPSSVNQDRRTQSETSSPDVPLRALSYVDCATIVCVMKRK